MDLTIEIEKKQQILLKPKYDTKYDTTKVSTSKEQSQLMFAGSNPKSN